MIGQSSYATSFSGNQVTKLQYFHIIYHLKRKGFTKTPEGARMQAHPYHRTRRLRQDHRYPALAGEMRVACGVAVAGFS
jgi:hypothetical protein